MSLDVSSLTKSWLNTNEGTRGILQIRLAERDGALRLRIWGAGDRDPVDWEEVHVKTLHADRPGSSRVMAFTAIYDFEFMRCHLQGNVNQGLLVVACFTAFHQKGVRSDYFAREFFHEVMA